MSKPLTMLETRGLAIILEDVEQILLKYDHPIANGAVCDRCNEYGGGTIVEHGAGCDGVRTLDNVRGALDRLGRSQRKFATG